MDLRESDAISESSEKVHWWYRTRFLCVDQAIKKAIEIFGSSRLRILEFGCGTAPNLLYAKEASPHRESLGEAFGFDPHFQETPPPTSQAGVTFTPRLEDVRDQSVQVALAMDVLEHADDDQKCLLELKQKMAPGGILLVSVPAFKSLWSHHDEFLGHKRRYTRSQLDDLARRCGFSIIRSFYIFSFVFPMVYIWRKLKLNKTGASDLRNLNPVFNRILGIMGWLESWLGGFPWFGTSAVGLYRLSGESNLKQHLEERQTRRQVLLTRTLVGLSFFVFFLFLVLCNYYDWDYFLAHFESDLQSWLRDHSPPLWSYVFCAGISRIGDPQAMGLSPLFLFQILFGSFFGAKLMVVALGFLGYWGLKSTFSVLVHAMTHTSKITAEDDRIVTSLSLLFIFQNYFLWHMVVGHLTFAPMYLFIGIIGLAAVCWDQGLSKSRAVGLVVLWWGLLSTGNYGALVYFILPAAVILGLLIPFFLRGQNRSLLTKKLLSILGLSVVGVLLASYKWLAVAFYQQGHPRTIVEHLRDVASPLEVLSSLLLPVWMHRYLGFPSLRWSYGMWERSSFSLLIWTLPVVLGYWVKTPRLSKGRLGAFIVILAGLFCFFGILLSMGEYSGWSLFGWVNTFFLRNSMRIPGRFQILILTGVLLLVFWGVMSQPARRHLFSRVLFSLAWVNLLFLLQFWVDLDFTFAKSLLRIPFNHGDQAHQVAFLTEDAHGNPRTMYPFIRAQTAVMNCYNPLVNYRLARNKYLKVHDFPLDTPVSFLRLPKESPRSVLEDCSRRSYFMQNRVIVDSSCPRGTCLYLNNIAPNDPIMSRLEFVGGLFCLK